MNRARSLAVLALAGSLLAACGSSTPQALKVTISPVLSAGECGMPAPAPSSLRLPHSAVVVIKTSYSPTKLASLSGSLDPCDLNWAVYHVSAKQEDVNYGFMSKESGKWVILDSGSFMVGATTVPPTIMKDLGGSPGVSLQLTGTTTSCGSPRSQVIGDPNTLPAAAQMIVRHQAGKVTGTIDPCDHTWAAYKVVSTSLGNEMGYVHLEKGMWVGIDNGTNEVGWTTVPTSVINDLPTRFSS